MHFFLLSIFFIIEVKMWKFKKTIYKIIKSLDALNVQIPPSTTKDLVRSIFLGFLICIMSTTPSSRINIILVVHTLNF